MKYIVPAFALFLSGCVESFTYRPPMHQPGSPHFNLRVGVVQFDDKTEDFTDIGLESASPDWVINLVKGGGKSVGIPQITAQQFTEYFADDLENSRLFESVRIFGSRAEMPNTDVAVQGLILKADLSGHARPSQLVVRFIAVSLQDRRVLWDETLTQNSTRELTDCTDRACAFRHLDLFLQKLIEGLFSQARGRLAAHLPKSS